MVAAGVAAPLRGWRPSPGEASLSMSPRSQRLRGLRSLTSVVMLAAAVVTWRPSWVVGPSFTGGAASPRGLIAARVLQASNSPSSRTTSLVLRRAEEIFVPIFPDQQRVGATVPIERTLGEESRLVVVQAEMPLGLKIGKGEDGQGFVVEDIIGGGSASMGAFEIGVGDVIKAVSTSGSKPGSKTVKLTDSFAEVGELSEAIMANEDDRVTMVLETERADPNSAQAAFDGLMSEGLKFAR
mmetsp:Transcript_33463/g.92475  ORF Transcript_33463/g.92475 Transcript_33463/m.92475 type:complete len:240 (-) Transcript_33463:136-855(-)